jgi:hypothetical protein
MWTAVFRKRICANEERELPELRKKAAGGDQLLSQQSCRFLPHVRSLLEMKNRSGVGCAAALATLVAEAERGRSAMLSVGFHLRTCGRPARFAAVRSILAASSGLGERVWIARRAEIAEHFRALA